MDSDFATDAARWMDRARAWLDELQTPSGLRASSVEGRFHAIFGRDTLWSVLFVLEAAALRPADADLRAWSLEMAARSLRALARLQGRRQDDLNEEQPGKIVHEYWPEPPQDLLAQGWPLREGRYYGSVDATFLFLMAASALWRLGPAARALVDELWEPLRRALEWTLRDADVDGDGLVEAAPRQPEGRGLRNQVWEDSQDAARLPDGSYPQPPLAWVELQGYAIAAARGLRDILADRGEDPALQAELERRANAAAARLDQFWLPAEDCPAIALTRGKTPVPMVASNMGHLLWCAALPAQQARATIARLMRADLFSAWGLRTVSDRSYAFDPGSYHCGSVWPFDNAVTAGALWRLGHHAEARAIGRRVLAAIQAFATPVELYCVLPAAWVKAPTESGDVLYDYVPACRVQAWSAAAVLLFGAHLLASPLP